MTKLAGTALPSAARPAIPLLPFVAAIVVMAYVGLHLSVASFAERPEHPPAVGEAVATTFGSITVTGLETINGLTSEDLGGRVHGVSGLVTAESAAVRLTILVANRSDRVARIVPADFELTLDGAVAASGPTETSIAADAVIEADAAPGLRAVPPRSSLEATVVFVVPRIAAELTVTYAAPDGEPVAIATGHTTDGPVTAGPHADDAESHP